MKAILMRLAFVLVTLLLFIRPVVDPDFWWHIAVGRYIQSTYQFPRTDLFSFSQPLYPYVYHSWLTEFILFHIYSAFHLIGVSFYYTLLDTAGFLLLLLSYVKNRKPFSILTMLLFLACIPLYGYIVHTRTQTISFLFLCILSFLWNKYTENLFFEGKKWVFLPILFFLWVNLHGGFILGILLLGLLYLTYSITLIKHPVSSDRIYKFFRITFIVISCIFATWISPYGTKSYLEVWFMATNPAIKILNQDWYPLFSISGHSYILGIIFSIGICIILLEKSLSSKKKLIINILFISSLFSRRYALPLSVLLFPEMAICGSRFLSKFISISTDRVSRIFTYYILGVLGVTILMIIPINISDIKAAYQSPASYATFTKDIPFPVGVMDYMRRFRFPQRLLNDYQWGGFLVWYFPDQKVFITNNMDAYNVNGTSFAKPYWILTQTQPGWEKLFYQYNFDAVLAIKMQNWPLIEKLLSNPDWNVVYEDKESILMEKNRL